LETRSLWGGILMLFQVRLSVVLDVEAEDEDAAREIAAMSVIRKEGVLRIEQRTALPADAVASRERDSRALASRLIDAADAIRLVGEDFASVDPMDTAPFMREALARAVELAEEAHADFSLE
jgi:hypothetical protein